MTGGDFIEAMGWGSGFLLIWLLLLGRIAPGFWPGVALAFFLLTGLSATVAKGNARGVERK